jgi:hypothetical protein
MQRLYKCNKEEVCLLCGWFKQSNTIIRLPLEAPREEEEEVEELV